MNTASLIVAAALIAVASSTMNPAKAAFFNLSDYEHAIGGAKNQQIAMPSQVVTFADRYGSFTATTLGQPVDTSYVPAGYGHGGYQNPSPLAWRGFMSSRLSDGAAGSLVGHYECHSSYYGCLGVDTITYKLPFAIQAMAGMLNARDWYSAVLDRDIPFFQLGPTNYTESRVPPYCAPGSCYKGFWGITFAQPTDTITIAWKPFDGGADFVLSDLLVVAAREGNNGNGPVRVPEPSTVALLLAGLLGLGALRARRMPAAGKASPSASATRR